MNEKDTFVPLNLLIRKKIKMSYDIELINTETGKVFPWFRNEMGGTYAIRDEGFTEFNITYNYGSFYKSLHSDGLRYLDNKIAKETTESLYKLVKKLGTDRYTGDYFHIDTSKILESFFKEKCLDDECLSFLKKNNGIDFDDPKNSEIKKEGLRLGFLEKSSGYWKATPGNAGYSLNILLVWSLVYPEGIWKIS